MEAIADLLESKIAHLSDQLELAIMGWASYQHHGKDLVGYLEYDVYEFIGTLVEVIYLDYPEYTTEMARAEGYRVSQAISRKLIDVIDSLRPQLEEHILPLLTAGDSNTHVGAVSLVGGDMAVRIDDVTYETQHALGSGANVGHAVVS